MRIIQRISAITILFILVAGSMLFLVQAPGKGNASGAGIPGKLEFGQPAPDSIFPLYGTMQIEWAPVADVDWYRIEWTDDPGQRGDNGNYSQIRGAEGRVDGTNHSLDLNDANFEEGWWFFHVFGVQDGNNNGVPEDWTEWSDDVRFAVDNKPPTITLNYPQQDHLHQSNMITLAGTANDNFGIKEIVYQLDGSGETISYQDKPTDINWNSQEIGIGSGEHTFEVKAVDWAGRESNTVQSRFSVDLEDPVISINVPDNDQVFYEGRHISFGGTASDDNKIMEMRYWFNNEGPFQTNIPGGDGSDGNNEWNLEADLQDGANIFSIMATDKADRSSENNITVYYDSDNPRVEITDYQNPDGGDGWHAEKKDFGDGMDWYLIDGSSYEGDLVGYVEDSCGVENLNLLTRYNEIQEPEEDSQEFEIVGDSLPTFNSRVDWKTSLNFEGDGIYEIVVMAEDRTNDKQGDDKVRFVSDSQNPEIESLQTEDNQFVIQENPLSFGLQVNDNVGIVLAQYKIDDGDWVEYFKYDPSQGAPPKDHYQDMEVDIPDGQHGMELMIIDIGGHDTSVSYTVILDTEEPSVQINEPSENDFIDSLDFNIQGSAEDDSGQIDRVEIRFLRPWEEGNTDPEGMWMSVEGKKDWNFDWKSQDGGQWVIQARSVDKIGQISEVLSVHVSLPGETPNQEDLQNEGEEGSDSSELILGIAVGLVIVIVMFLIFISTSKGVTKAEKELKRLEDVLEEKKAKKE